MEEVLDKIKEQAGKAKDSAAKITKTVIDKTNNIVSQTKIKFAISDTKGKIKEIYTEIGKAVYEEYAGGEDAADTAAEKCVKIDALRGELSELEERLSELDGTAKCTKCGAYNRSDDSYCSKCGSKLSKEDSDKEEYDEDYAVEITPKNDDETDD